MDDWYSYSVTYRKRSDNDPAALMVASYALDHIVQIHKFEKRMCNKLQETGLATFAQASDCIRGFPQAHNFQCYGRCEIDAI